jgi:signal transduction histidine kinase
MFRFTFLRSLAFFFFLFLCYSHPALSQQHTEDSLLRIVNEKPNDNSAFRALKALGDLNGKNNAPKAIRYLKRATAFPFHLEYSKEFVEVYNAMGELYHILGLYDSSVLMHRLAIGLAQKFNFEKEIALADQGIALTYLRQSQHDSSRFYLQQALLISVRLGLHSLEAGININLGNVFLEETKYPEAINQFIKASKIYEGVAHDKAGLGKALVNIGNIESILGHYDKALDYTQRSLQLSEETGNDLNVAYCHRLKGRIFRKQGNYEKALPEYREASKVYRQRSDHRNESETLQNVGNIYYDMHRYTEALKEYDKSLEIARSISNPALMAYGYSGLGFTWYELRKYNKAIAYFDSSTLKAKEIKNRYLVMDAYEVISQINEEQKKYKEALAFHHAFSALKDSLTSEENRKGAEEMEAKYQNAQKQNQIELLQKDQQLKDISIQQNRILQIAMVTAFVLLIVIGLLVFNRHRLIHQSKRQMEIEQVRNEIARDLHDDIGSTLSSINILSQLAIKENQTASTATYFQRIAEQSAKMMESMSDMVWSINPDNDTIQKMLARMKEFTSEILEPKNIAYEFDGEDTLHDLSLDVAERKNIFLIFKETINNAAKYSECSFIRISILHLQGFLQLTITDNGRGFDLLKAPAGNGLNNMKERAEEIKATWNLETSPGQGTTTTLVVPLT